MNKIINSQSNSSKNIKLGLSYALAGTFLQSTNYVTAKYGLRGFNPESFSLVWTSSQMLIAKDRIKRINTKALVFYRVAIGTCIIAVWTLISGKLNFDVEMSYWLVTLLGALLGPTVSFLFTFQSYRYWEFYRSSMVLTIQPLFVLPMAFLILRQLPGKLEMLGGLIMLMGALWLILVHLHKTRELVHR